MKIATLFVKRPVMATMVFVSVALFGILSFWQLPRELFPNISVPQLVILTKYANAAPEEIENLLTKPIEEAVGTVPNLKRVKSISKEGLSVVMLDFRWGTDMGFAHLSVREKLDRMKDQLPNEAEESIIKRVNPFAHPIMIVSVTGNLPLEDMTTLCDEVIKKKLEKTDGVAAVTISGGQKKEILVDVDRGRLDASHVSLPMVVDALKNANYDYPAGITQGKVVEYLVRTHGRFKKVEDVGKTVVQVENPEYDPVFKWSKREEKSNESAPRGQRLIMLQDLAEIKTSLQDKTSFSRYNGRENISISIQKQADANTVRVSKAVKASLDELRGSLPQGLKTEIIYNEATYIQASLGDMFLNIVLGGLLAFFVLFVFFGNVRDSLFAGLTIPLAAMGTFIMMFTTGSSINMLTLAGLALSVGAMSDCSICMSENITRHHKRLGKPLLEASIDGSEEMTIAMLSSTLTNVAVLLPLLFVSGIAQQLFRGLFIVTIFTHFAGLLASVSFIPRMSAYEWRLFKERETPKWLTRFMISDQKLEQIYGRYRRLLRYVLDRPMQVAIGAFMLLALSLLVLTWMPRMFMPKMDQGQFIAQLNMPIGTRLEVTNSIAQKLENILSSFEGVNVAVTVGSTQEDEDIDALQPHQAQLVVTNNFFKGITTPELIDRFKTLIVHENLGGGTIKYVLQDSPLRAALSGGAPIEIEVKGPDLARLKYMSDELVKNLSQDPNIYSVQTTFALPSRETQVVVDKDRAAGFQLSVADIARTAIIAIKGVVATTFKENGKDTDIRVRLRKEDRENSESIRLLSLRSPRGETIPLDTVGQVKPGMGSSEIRHLDQQRSVVVTGEITGASVNQVLARTSKMLSGYRAFKDYNLDLGGESKQMAEAFGSLRYTFILAIFLVYMIMAAQFESLMQPLIIMFTVPLSIIGVAFTIFITNTSLSSVVVLGVVILAGIVVNNGIVLIDHLNNLLKEGMNLKEAVIEGSITRLRPIVMTMATAVLGVVPLAVGIGKGDELAQPLALVTFGGLFVSTMLTLVLIPLLYYRMTLWNTGQNR